MYSCILFCSPPRGSAAGGGVGPAHAGLLCQGRKTSRVCFLKLSFKLHEYVPRVKWGVFGNVAVIFQAEVVYRLETCGKKEMRCVDGIRNEPRLQTRKYRRATFNSLLDIQEYVKIYKSMLSFTSIS